MTRGPYKLQARAERQRANRQRVIDTARELFLNNGFHGASLEEVARAAGVSRATVYEQFHSKFGLVEAIALDLDERGNVADLIAAMQAPSALDSAQLGLRAGYAIYAINRDLFRALYGLATSDDDVAELLETREVGRRAVSKLFADRLVEAGLARQDVGGDELETMFLVLTKFSTYDELCELPGDPADRAIAMLNRLLRKRR